MATKFNIKRSLWLVLLILSFWKESRDFCLWIMQTRFISDAFIFILGRTCQILFSWRSHFRWTVGLFDWLPDFLFFWTCSSDPKYFSNEPKPKSFQKFHTIYLRILFFRPNYVNLPPLFLTWTAVLQKWRMMKFNFWSKDQLTKKIRTGSYK